MTNKSKNIILLIGFLVTMVICYQFAISKTLDNKRTYKSLMQEDELYKNIPKQLSVLKRKQHYYDSILSSNKLEGGSIQNSLLNTINKYSEKNNLNVISFLEPHKELKNDLLINTYEFVLQGNYDDIIKLILLLEQQTKFGEVINLHFEKKKNYRTGRNYLEVKVLLKSFG